MQAVVLTGSAGTLGRRVLAALVERPDVGRITALDRIDGEQAQAPQVEFHRVDLVNEPLDQWFDGCDTVIHLASVFAPERMGDRPTIDVEISRRVLAAAEAAGARRVVLMSSATVYGAWPDNPVPITEEAPLRPNEGFDFAADKVQIEELAAELRRRVPNVAVAVLRPTVTLAAESRSWMSAALASAAAIGVSDLDPPVQFLHFDDLARAVVLVAAQGFDGALNVAPDGWISPDAMRSFATLPRPRVPVWVADNLARMRSRLGSSAPPPEILPWTIHPWVVANDRLRALGWAPEFSNEEAYVEGTKPGPFETLTPKRRQELALAVAGGALVAAGAGVAAVVRRQLRSR